MTLKEGKVIPTNTLFLTFGSPELPKEITVGHLKVKAALFVPNPIRCFNCNKSGHTSQRCKVAAKFQWCGKDKHEGLCEGPACALTAVVQVPKPHRVKIARSCRRREFSASALKNAFSFRKPDSW